MFWVVDVIHLFKTAILSPIIRLIDFCDYISASTKYSCSQLSLNSGLPDVSIWNVFSVYIVYKIASNHVSLINRVPMYSVIVQ